MEKLNESGTNFAEAEKPQSESCLLFRERFSTSVKPQFTGLYHFYGWRSPSFAARSFPQNIQERKKLSNSGHNFAFLNTAMPGLLGVTWTFLSARK
ncbi:hypothetical protein [uncultured Senegalimassilia sp.]|uniref:hypothetical protein n=1 Tax=uncultured Senegalimassilia sp. TaxID=1714350 RepID=UPI0026E0E1B5|nr:hypothetical protein [uncultured Senegalimassilia sp.]